MTPLSSTTLSSATSLAFRSRKGAANGNWAAKAKPTGAHPGDAPLSRRQRSGRQKPPAHSPNRLQAAIERPTRTARSACRGHASRPLRGYSGAERPVDHGGLGRPRGNRVAKPCPPLTARQPRPRYVQRVIAGTGQVRAHRHRSPDLHGLAPARDLGQQVGPLAANARHPCPPRRRSLGSARRRRCCDMRLDVRSLCESNRFGDSAQRRGATQTAQGTNTGNGDTHQQSRSRRPSATARRRGARAGPVPLQGGGQHARWNCTTALLSLAPTPEVIRRDRRRARGAPRKPRWLSIVTDFGRGHGATTMDSCAARSGGGAARIARGSVVLGAGARRSERRIGGAW